MPELSPKIQLRIRRFCTGMSIAEIARQDGVKPISVYHSLRDHGVLTDSYLADEFVKALASAELPTPEVEYLFVRMAPPEQQALFLTKTGKVRSWRADFAFPFHQLAVEIDGGKHIGRGGAHNNDREKRNAYAVLGYRVLYFDTDMILGDVAACVGIVRAALTSQD